MLSDFDSFCMIVGKFVVYSGTVSVSIVAFIMVVGVPISIGRGLWKTWLRKPTPLTSRLGRELVFHPTDKLDPQQAETNKLPIIPADRI